MAKKDIMFKVNKKCSFVQKKLFFHQSAAVFLKYIRIYYAW